MVRLGSRSFYSIAREDWDMQQEFCLEQLGIAWGLGVFIG